MKGLKCFTVLFLFFIMLGLSFVVSSDVNALRHDITTLPLLSEATNPTNITPAGATGEGNPRFQIRWSNQYKQDSTSKSHALYFTSRLSNNKCTFVSGSDHYYQTPTFSDDNSGYRSFEFGIPSYRFDYGYNAPADTVQCRQGVPFGQLYSSQTNLGVHPSFDDSSLVNIPAYQRPLFSNLLPYYFSFSGMYRYHSITSDGIDYTHVLKMSDILGYNLDKPYRIVIPLGMNQPDITGQITSGRNLTYTGQFNFDSSFAWRSDIGSNLEFNLNWVGFDSSDISNGTNHYGSVPCSIRNTSILNEKVVSFSCSFDSPITVVDGQFWAWLYINDLSSNYLFSTTGDMRFSVAYLTTDYDDTPGDSLGREVVGNSALQAPGSAYNDIPSNNDFTFNLANLFNFGFLNPFQPLFNLFSDDNTCASIPTISSWLHTEDTQVCHFFPSSVRNVLTPVFGLASSMLLFGFAVRWLGSSSGNFFEDTSAETLGYSDKTGFRPRLSYHSGQRRFNK